MHITDDQINQIHRLGWGEEWSERRIAKSLGIDRSTVHKYLHNPYRAPDSPNGARFCTIRLLRQLLLTGSWKTPKSFILPVQASEILNCNQAPLCDDNPSPEESDGLTPHRRCGWGEDNTHSRSSL